MLIGAEAAFSLIFGVVLIGFGLDFVWRRERHVVRVRRMRAEAWAWQRWVLPPASPTAYVVFGSGLVVAGGLYIAFGLLQA